MQLRNRKQQAHFYIDWIWREGLMKRSEVYKTLSERIKISKTKTHLSKIKTKKEAKVIMNEAKKFRKELLKNKLNKINDNNPEG